MKDPALDSPPSQPVVQVRDETLRALFGYRMKRAFNVIKADLAKTLKPFELRMLTYTALVLIVDNPGLRQSQLADAMDIERPNLVSIVDELEQRGLIVRHRTPADRRAYALQATRAGQQLNDKAVAAVAAHETNLLKDMDHEMRATTIEALKRIERRRQNG